MNGRAVVDQVLRFDVRSYVDAARERGRGALDPSLRAHMAGLYEDLRPRLIGAIEGVSGEERRRLRLAELVLQNEWKLASGGDEVIQPHPDVPPEYRGRRNLSYANMRLLNEAAGVRRHTSDQVIETRCWEAIRYLLHSWARHEERTAAGEERWCAADPPGAAELAERVRRLRDLHRSVSARAGALRAADTPPRTWAGYTGRRARANLLEYLLVLPYGPRHDEGAFLRSIHLVEVATWAVLARTMSAIDWLRGGSYDAAAACLHRAADLADLMVGVLLVLRRTMSVERFRALRADTGDSSAVQSAGSQLLHIHLIGVHPAKVTALRGVRENAFLLLHRGGAFEPLWAALHRARRAAGADAVMTAARRLDERLFDWRRVHLGLAYRYLPPQAGGTGGTSGAPYLAAFYRTRIFDASGELRPYAAAPPDHGRPALADDRLRARPVFSFHN